MGSLSSAEEEEEEEEECIAVQFLPQQHYWDWDDKAA